MSAVAIVPLKDLVGAKTRLAGLLSSSERRALAQVMAEDVMTCLSRCPQIESVILVSDDPGAHLLADSYGARLIREQSLGVSGLNAVLMAVCEQLRETPGRRLVLHADLPLLAEADIEAVLSHQAAWVLGTDRHGQGSNLFAFAAGTEPQFAFGANSCSAHRSMALAAGVELAVLQRSGIALDVDKPEDLALLLEQLPEHSHTGRWLYQEGRFGRITLALQAMGLPVNTEQRLNNA